MESKLTIEHLAPYLPYRLKFYSPYTLNGEMAYNVEELTGSMLQALLYPKSAFKTALRPISDLNPLFLVDGIEDVTNYLSKNDISKIVNEKMPLYYIPYGQFLRLVSWHFDVFGLINNGLAIDINTLPHAK